MKNNTTLHPVHIIGIGPGDPDQLTIKAHRIIEESDIILYDCLANQCLLENEKYMKKSLLLEKDPSFEKMIDTIEKLYLEGKKVARLRSGDAMMFNSGGIESLKLRERSVPFEVVAGITAACAASNIFAIPTTELNESDAIVHFISHDTDENYAHIREVSKLFKYGTTLALYMANSNLPKILTIFEEENIDMEMPVVVVSRVSMVDEAGIQTKLSKLIQDINDSKLRSPLIFFIGKHISILQKKRK